MALSSKRFSNNPALEKAANNQPPLKRGVSGGAVKPLQQALHDLGFEMPKSIKKGFPDGIFGSETEAVVKTFQKANALTQDGVAGRDTLTRLDAIFQSLEEAAQLQEKVE